MDFKEYVSSNKNQIYSKIMEYLPLKEPKEHYIMVRDYSERQGGYRRPGLIMLTGQMFGAKPEDLILPAAAMQISEDWILIHDDIEDNSELRRGKPALHKLYGSELAINAGDAVHMAMWKMLKDYIEMKGLKKGGVIYDKFYKMLEYTVEGQYIETNFIYNVRSIASASEDLYIRIASSKTGYYTVYGPMQIGALVAGQKDSTLDMLKEIGHPAGIAFQITDDILDMIADEKVFGKKRYGDLYEGKLTLIILYTYRKANAFEREKMEKIFSKRREQKSEEEIFFLADLVDKYGGINFAKEKAKHYANLSKKAFEKYEGKLPNNQYKDIMLSFIDEAYKRHK